MFTSRSIEIARREAAGICLCYNDFRSLVSINRTFSMFEKFPGKRFQILKAIEKVLKKNIQDKEELYQLTLVLDELHSMFDVSCAD